jgi:pyruvoyl-dependent arginine decarboxylase (PvlArgDC)
VPVVEIIVTPDIKSNDESGIIPETVTKSKKKSKKKSSNKSAESEMSVSVETTIETQEVSASPFVESEVPEYKQSDVKEEGNFPS